MFHESYFPDPKPIRVKVIFGPDKGVARLLEMILCHHLANYGTKNRASEILLRHSCFD